MALSRPFRLAKANLSAKFLYSGFLLSAIGEAGCEVSAFWQNGGTLSFSGGDSKRL